jgi:hypothetical protein
MHIVMSGMAKRDLQELVKVTQGAVAIETEVKYFDR